jgi:hypothetical protein
MQPVEVVEATALAQERDRVLAEVREFLASEEAANRAFELFYERGEPILPSLHAALVGVASRLTAALTQPDQPPQKGGR